MAEERLVEDPLFLACTRPAMVMGVPMEAMGVNVKSTSGPVITKAGERIRYAAGPVGAEYIAICLPAFTAETAHRED